MYRFMYPGFFGFMPGLETIANLLIAVGIFSFMRHILLSRRKELELPEKRPDPLEILTERFAHGELSVDEFEERAKALEAHRVK